MLKKPDISPDKPYKSTFSKALSVLAYPTALIGGLAAASIRTRQFFYKNIAKQGTFDDLQVQRKAEYNKLTQGAKRSIGYDLKEEIAAIEKDYSAAATKRIESMGYHGVQDYFSGLKRNQKLDVAILFAGVSSITIGALLTMANHQDKLAASQHQPNETDQSIG